MVRCGGEVHNLICDANLMLLVLEGKLAMQFPADADEPTYSMTDRGVQAAKELSVVIDGK